MTLIWKGTPGNVIAHGVRALYTIQSLSPTATYPAGVHVLQGFRHADDAVLPELGMFGQQYGSLGLAQGRAEEVDRPEIVEEFG